MLSCKHDIKITFNIMWLGRARRISFYAAFKEKRDPFLLSS